MKIILLGNERLNQYSHKDVYHYLFNNEISDVKNTILESNYLNQTQINCAYNHLAEFSAYYVFAKYNPLSLKDDDTLTLVSARKFESETGLSITDVLNFSEKIDKLLRDNSIYAFLHHNRNDIHTIFNYKPILSDVNNMLMNFEQTYPYISDVRNRFDNYPIHPGRHYFCFTFKILKNFVDWVHKNLFLKFFNEDFTEKFDENGQSLIYKTHPPTKTYNPHRAFGLLMENFHHKFFYETNTAQYWHPYQQKTPDHVYRCLHYDEDLNFSITKVQI